VNNAQDAGAVAVIVANNAPGAPTTMGGSDPGIAIPSVMVSLDDGNTIKSGLPATGRVHGTLPANPSRVGVDSVAWGHEGGNDISIEIVDPGAPSQALSVSVLGSLIRVSLATDSSGSLISTAAQFVAALNAEAGSLVQAYTYRGNAGNGIVSPAGPTLLSDNLSAPDSVSRDPHPVYAIRIGKHRDDSKVGVLAYAQEHAREWVPPLVTVETAERLLRNYAHDGETKKLFWGASSRILTAIKQHRGLSVTPARTGPISDVLYSAAGNSGDMLWYKYGIYAWNFEVGTSFQPPWPSAHNETMEFSNGLVELMRVAYDFDKDSQRPKSALVESAGSEPGTVGEPQPCSPTGRVLPAGAA
jgi:hypothetical protein